jgi:uncharacterized protein YceH (UPF0502 family)
MNPFETLDDVKNMLTALATREQPMVKELPPAPGSRAERYMQLLSPDAHPVPVAEQSAAATGTSASYVAPTPLASRVTALEAEVTLLRDTIRKLAQALGEPDPFPVK